MRTGVSVDDFIRLATSQRARWEIRSSTIDPPEIVAVLWWSGRVIIGHGQSGTEACRDCLEKLRPGVVA